MTRSEIINSLKSYFDIRELVCDHTYKKFGETSWQFLDNRALETLLILRTKIFKRGMTCNTYHLGGKYTQRGFRCNICQIPKDKTLKDKIYLSAHCNGCGFDFWVTGISAEEARNIIRNNKDKLPYPVRIEKDVTWLHIDFYDSLNDQKVTEFNG